MSAAGVAYAITKSCSRGELNECSCDNKVRLRKPKGNWQWGGCSEVWHITIFLRLKPWSLFILISGHSIRRNVQQGFCGLERRRWIRRGTNEPAQQWGWKTSEISSHQYLWKLEYIIAWFSDDQVSHAEGVQMSRNVGFVQHARLLAQTAALPPSRGHADFAIWGCGAR